MLNTVLGFLVGVGLICFFCLVMSFLAVVYSAVKKSSE